MDKVRLLVVEDERIVSMDLQSRLKSMGYQVVGSAVSGEEAVEKAEILRPDMVLMDIMLDGKLDGIQAAEMIGNRYSIPVIYLTAYADTATLERAKITEPFGYILKPFEERELHGHIEIALYKHRMEKKLKDSEERYVLASLGANDGLWDWDLRTHRIYFSPRWKAMLGFGDEEIGHDPREWFSRIHPDDRSRVKQSLAGHIKGRIPHFECEYRILGRDGEYRWALTRGMALSDAGGKAHRIAGSQTDITERKLYDPLTGLPNRILLIDRIQSILDKKRSRDAHFSVFSVKLPDFREVVTSIHGDRDANLCEVVQRIQDALHAGDTLAHLGDETLGVLISEVRTPHEACSIAERLLEAMKRPFKVEDREVYFQCAIGVVLSEGYFNPDDLVRDATTAMNRAKGAGRSNVELFDERMRKRISARVQKEAELRRAVDTEEFQVYYQPIVSLNDGSIAGFEALARWHHRDGLRLPAEFISVSEETGLIIPIERFILREALRQMKEWEETLKLPEGTTISVNLSPQHYLEPDLVDEIQRLLKDTGLDAGRLKLEITESALMHDTEAVSETLEALNALHVKLAMDDFGTGYSSLSYLHRFPLKTLKIDRSFVSNLGRKNESRKIVQAIVALARNLGMDVTAEGVENTRQVVELQAFDCSHAQGFLFSRPVSAEAAGLLLAQKQHWLSETGEFSEAALIG